MNPKISIIITSYNIQDFIEASVKSIIEQTIKNIEIIIIDDSSTDNTPKLIKDLASKDDRIITVFMEKNSPGGVATPANIGLDLAKGDYIGFADGDDLYDKSMFEKLYNSAMAHNADMSLCGFMEFENETGIYNKPYDPEWDTLAINSFLDIDNTDNNKKFLLLSPVPWRKLYKRKFMEKNNLKFPVGPYFFEDNSFHWLTAINATRVSFVNETLCYHRRNRFGQTMSASGNKLLGIFHQHEVIHNYIVQNNYYENFKNSSLKWLLTHLAWVDNTLDPIFSEDLYSIFQKELNLYDKKTIRDVIKDMNLSRKTIELIVCIFRKDKDYFIEVMNGKTSTKTFEKIIFNKKKLGTRLFTVMIVRYIFSYIKEKIKKIIKNRKLTQELDNKLFYLIELSRLNQKNIIEIDNKSFYLIEELRRINSEKLSSIVDEQKNINKNNSDLHKRVEYLEKLIEIKLSMKK